MANSLSFDNSEFMDMALDNSPYEMNAVCQQNDSVYRIPPNLMSSPQYCQPYLDHPYAMLGASAASSSSAVEASHVPAMAEPLEPLAAYIDIEDVSCNTTVVTAPMDRDASDDSNEGDPWEGSVTRCICDFQHDDGYMICCDRCGVWQHVDCMGVDRNNIPESYLCELCHPRPIDKRRAIRLQTIKKEQMESEASATDSSSDEQTGRGGGGGGGRGSGRKRRESSRRRLDGRPSLPQQPNQPPAKRRTTSEPNDEKPDGRRNRQSTNSKPGGSRGARRLSTGEGSTRTRRNSVFDAQHHVTIDHSVEDVCQNSYTNGILMLLASVREREVTAGKVATSTPINPSLLKEQISKPRIRVTQFSPDAKGIAATETIRVNQAVAEYTGRVMMADEYELDNQLNVFVPFVLRYSGAQGVNVCIDSSISGNDARYVRCSCMPNAKVVHVIDQSTIRFFLCATKNIAEGREVTIPFYFDYQKCNSEVTCACHRASCQVARFFKQKSSSRPVRVRRNATFVVPEAKPRATSSAEALDNGKGAAMPSGVGQNSRRSAASSELRRTTQVMSPDVGADITLMNALTAISSTTVASGSTPRALICSTGGQQPNGGYASSPVANAECRPEASMATATRSSLTLTKEMARGERGRKATGNGRNRSQPQPETSLESRVGRVATVRSSRLRDKAQQQISSMSSHQD